jgi:F-type H+-transporting ATPase subunit epsilon
MAGETPFNAKVLTPEGEVFDGEVVQLSTRTAVGEIGVLANHAPMLARLRPTELRLHTGGSDVTRFAQAEGWLEVFGNHALVLVGEAIAPDALDASQLKERIAAADQRLSESDEGTAAHDAAEQEKERAEAFLAVTENA